MKDLDLIWEGVPPQPWEKSYRSYLESLLDSSGARGWAVSVTLCGDEFIRTLNRDFRQKDEPTDVLSFVETPEDRPDLPGEGPWILGDLIISLDTLRVNAPYFGVSENEEFKRITLHGLLHLQGWDHETNEPGEPMLRHQEEILKQYSGVKILA